MKAIGRFSTPRLALLLSGILVWPLIPGVPYDLANTAVLACEYCVVALSLVLLIGLVGQISLCQAALVGMGAFVSAIATLRFGIHFPFTLVVGLGTGAATAAIIGVVALRVRGLYLAVATLIFGYLCDQYLFTQPWLVQSQSGVSIPIEVIGRPGTIPSFDLADARTFYYFAFAVAIVSLYSLANLRESRLGRAFAAVRGSEVAAASLGIDVTRIKLLGFACAGGLAGLGGALTLVGERNVVPQQFDFVSSLYFLSIAVVGGLRSLGGAVASSLVFALLVGEVFFRLPRLADYLDVISAGLLALVLLFFRGGLGAVPQRLQHLWQAHLEGVFAQPLRRLGVTRPATEAPAQQPQWAVALAKVAESVGESVSRLRHAASSLALRPRGEVTGNLAVEAGAGGGQNEGTVVSLPAMNASQAASRIDVVSVVDELIPAAAPPPPQPADTFLRREPATQTLDPEALLRRAEQHSRIAGAQGAGGRRLPELIRAENITVRFGGLTAVNDASLSVCAGEIVGLIGPNGAGKTTLFNSLLGLNQPTAGRVELYGQDVTSWAVHQRAALGVGRTFQILQLFGDLTVFENLLVATHLQNHTGLWGSLMVSRRARTAEQAVRERVRSVLRLMELDGVADRQVAGLPFGMLRLIEVARTLVTGAGLVCFDEPASGLDSTETERLIRWFQFLRQIGITLLVIEHDVDMVVRLCDWIYVLDQGRLIANGPPSQIQRDPAVIASYLGAPMEVA